MVAPLFSRSSNLCFSDPTTTTTSPPPPPPRCPIAPRVPLPCRSCTDEELRASVAALERTLGLLAPVHHGDDKSDASLPLISDMLALALDVAVGRALSLRAEERSKRQHLFDAKARHAP